MRSARPGRAGGRGQEARGGRGGRGPARQGGARLGGLALGRRRRQEGRGRRRPGRRRGRRDARRPHPRGRGGAQGAGHGAGGRAAAGRAPVRAPPAPALRPGDALEAAARALETSCGAAERRFRPWRHTPCLGKTHAVGQSLLKKWSNNATKPLGTCILIQCNFLWYSLLPDPLRHCAARVAPHPCQDTVRAAQ